MNLKEKFHGESAGRVGAYIFYAMCGVFTLIVGLIGWGVVSVITATFC